MPLLVRVECHCLHTNYPAVSRQSLTHSLNVVTQTAHKIFGLEAVGVTKIFTAADRCESICCHSYDNLPAAKLFEAVTLCVLSMIWQTLHMRDWFGLGCREDSTRSQTILFYTFYPTPRLACENIFAFEAQHTSEYFPCKTKGELFQSTPRLACQNILAFEAVHRLTQFPCRSKGEYYSLLATACTHKNIW